MSTTDQPVYGSGKQSPKYAEAAGHAQCAGEHSHIVRLPILALDLSLGSFLSLTFTLCVFFDLTIPSMAMHEAWMMLLPGFIWISWTSFMIGFAESFVYGMYVAFVLGSIFNIAVRITSRNKGYENVV